LKHKNDFNKTECIEHSPSLLQDLHSHVRTPACPLFFPTTSQSLELPHFSNTNQHSHALTCNPANFNLSLCSLAYFLQLPTWSTIPLTFLNRCFVLPFPVFFSPSYPILNYVFHTLLLLNSILISKLLYITLHLLYPKQTSLLISLIITILYSLWVINQILIVCCF